MKLRASWGDVAAHLAARGDPLGVARIISLFPGRPGWDFRFRIDESGRTELLLQNPLFDAWANSQMLLSGLIPEVLCCDEIEIVTRTGTWTAEGIDRLRVPGNMDSWLDLANSNNNGSPALRLSGYFGTTLPWQVMDRTQVCGYLRSRTWLGSQKYRASSERVRWRVLAGIDFRISNCSEQKPTSPALDVNFDEPGLRVSVHSDESLGATSVRSADHGDISPIEIAMPLLQAARRQRVEHLQIEIEAPSEVVLGALGHVLVSPRLEQRLRHLSDDHDFNERLAKYGALLLQAKKIQQALKLNRRIEAARSSAPLTLNGKGVGLEPQSELGTVALFAKLEGMDALPFYFRSRAWASGEGIDVLADFQFDSSYAMDVDAPVEFEFRLKNFFTHRHPHEHVKLVVCWYLGMESDALGATSHPWLRYFKASSGRLPIVVMSELPGLVVGRESTLGPRRDR